MSENTPLSILKGPSRSYRDEHLHNIFENIARENKHNPAIIYEVDGQCRQHTYGELSTLTTKLAKIIRNIIISNNSPRNNDGDYIIAVKMAPSDHLIITLLAIWKAGAAYLPLDHNFPEWRTAHIVEDAKPVLIISDGVVSNHSHPQVISITELLNKTEVQLEEGIGNINLNHQVQDIAIVLYTSGSTGKPKGVRLPHRVLMNRLQWQFHEFPFGENEKVCVFKTALAFVDSVAEIWGPLLSGRTLLVVPKDYISDPERTVNILDKYEVQRLVLVPSLLRSLLLFLESRKKEKHLKNMNLWVCSGESLEKVVVDQFYNYFPENETKLCNFYGSTEVMADVTFYVISGRKQLDHFDKVPIGIPIDNTGIHLLDEHCHPMHVGTVGEVFVSGKNVAYGYVNNTDPDGKFIDNRSDSGHERYFRTGDFARIVDGVLIFEGRADSQVKVGGRRVDLSEIEQLLYTIDKITKAIVLCYKPGDLKQELLAFVTCEDGQDMNGLLIEAKLKKRLMWYMVPQVLVLKEMPFLVSGKIDRQKLLELYENTEETVGEINYDGISSEQMNVAKVLFETVASVLSNRARSAISLNANFYEIGGNSINSICLITKLNEQGYHIGIGEFISAKNFAEVLSQMKLDANVDNSGSPSRTFVCEPLKEGHKTDVTEIVFRSLYHQPGLQDWIVWNTTKSDYIKFVEDMWTSAMEHNLSFVINSEEGKVIGFCINFNDALFPEFVVERGLKALIEVMGYAEEQVRKRHISDRKVKAMNNLLITTDPSQSYQDNIAAVEFMEKEMLNVARRNNFQGVLCTNISKLTQQLAKVLNYDLVIDIQANQFVSEDGTKPFGLAPDDIRAHGLWKTVNQIDS